MATAEQQQPTPSRATVLDSVRAQLRGELGLIEHELPESEQLDLLPAADSVRLMRVVAALENEYDVEADDNAIRAADTVGDLVDLISAALADSDR
ncbi:acyl carrier protein [Nocardia sp. BMG51109]|uniref:acyl carrier protein n=1 Tax=Nocardia sp. BMG51109 TaxID=1056816 RepID=UPI0004B134E6|nr:acyl carrier protein [Nocardia sp. BMG51109]